MDIPETTNTDNDNGIESAINNAKHVKSQIDELLDIYAESDYDGLKEYFDKMTKKQLINFMRKNGSIDFSNIKGINAKADRDYLVKTAV